ESLPRFAAQPQPLRRPVFGKGARLQRIVDVAQAVERPVIGGFALPHELSRRAQLELTKIEDAESETVARAEIFRRRSDLANADEGAAGKAELILWRARPFRPDAQLAADGDDPIRRRREV